VAWQVSVEVTAKSRTQDSCRAFMDGARLHWPMADQVSMMKA
jgi:hypothetical protein